jgi:hypothetical protein
MTHARAIRVAVRVLRAGALLGVIVFVYLSTIGFPEWVVRAVQHEANRQGLDIRLDRLRLHYAYGLKADNVRWFMHEDDLHPCWQSPRLFIGLDWRAWWQGQPVWSYVVVEDGTFLFDWTGPLRDPEGPDILALRNTEVRIRRENSGLRMEHFASDVHGITLTGRGFIHAGTTPQPKAETMRIWQKMVRQNTALSEWIRALRDAEMKEEARASFDFMLYRDKPQMHYASCSFSSGATRFRGLLFDEVRVEGAWRDSKLEVPVLVLRHGERRLEGSWSLDTLNSLSELRLQSTLLPTYIRQMMPSSMRDRFDAARVRAEGELNVELEAGPSTISELLRNAQGRFFARGMDVRSAAFDRLSADLVTKGEKVRIENIQFEILNRQKRKEYGEARLSLDTDTSSYHGHVKTKMNPAFLLPLVAHARDASDVIQSLSFPSSAPEVEAWFSGRYGTNGVLHFNGTLRGRDFVYRGASVDSFSSAIEWTNKVLSLENMSVTRPEGKASGFLRLDFEEEISVFNLTSGLNPKALGRIAGPQTERILRPFHFDGPVDISAEGRMDFNQHETTSYRAKAIARQAGWGYYTADRIEADWIAESAHVTMTNITMEVLGGKVVGHIHLEGLGDPPVAYDLELRIHDLSFADLLRQALQMEKINRTGRLSASIQLSGLAEDDWKDSVTGHGTLRIRKGEIFRIPLLGGLSRLLSKIYEGFGFATQSDVRSTYTIGDRAIRSEEIRIEGNLLSLAGWGTYELDGYLDFRVQVKPLRRGVIVDAVRFVTYPVSRLLQFHLQGTPDEPVWRVENMPSDLFRLFNREKD